MIYLNVVLRVFKNFLKVVRGGKNGVKWGKNGGKKLGLESPYIHYSRYEQFLLFPQCFQKTCTADQVKIKICLGRG